MIDQPTTLPATDPLAGIATLIDRGITPEQLDKYLTVQQRYVAMEAERAYFESMNACQSEMQVAVWDSENKQTNSRYTSIEKIQELIRPIYVKHGFALSFSEDICEVPDNKRTKCDVMHVRGHSKRHFIDFFNDGIGPKGNAIGAMNRLQGQRSAMTYGQRTLLCQIFNLTTAGKDTDGNVPSSDKVSEEQLAKLNAVVAKIAWDDAGTAPFMAWCGVFDLADLPARKFDDTLSKLNLKLKNQM